MIKKLGQLWRKGKPQKRAVTTIEPPKFKSIGEERKTNATSYIVAILAISAAGFWIFHSKTEQTHNAVQPAANLAVPQFTGTQVDVTEAHLSEAEQTHNFAQPTHRSAVTSYAGTQVAATEVPLSKAASECCDWVRPYTRPDGTHVSGFWKSNGECGEGCPLAMKPKETVSSLKPSMHVGPRGGVYHIGRNGKKVYEHRK